MQRLELTWIGKGERINPEPRILIKNPAYSYGDADSSNMLIYGDNLLALKSLQQEYAGQIAAVVIDPPYNTSHAFQQYDDNVEHSIWLNLMKPRLELLRLLLSDNGSIWICIDDNEQAYLRVLCDEVFGRSNFVASVVWRSSDNSNNDAKQFSFDHNYILVYSKKPSWKPNKLQRRTEQSNHYNNPDNDPRGPWFDGNPLNSPNRRPNLTYDIIAPNGNIIKPPFNGWRWSEETLKEKMATGEIRFNTDYTNIKRRTYLYEQGGIPPSTLWADLDDTGHNRQAKYEQKKIHTDMNKNEWFSTPKPEKLIQKILTIATTPGDIVLDSFLGSGTTAAVAHKMNRRWIGIELGKHAYTHCIPRLKAVVDGEQGGISKTVNWQGGGGFKFYELAPTLLVKSEYGNLVISDKYNNEMLAQAMAKHEGYTYAPDKYIFWKQGYSGEFNFIYTTSGYLSPLYIDNLASQLGQDNYLLICAESFDKECIGRQKNIIISPIPRMLLGRCEWGKDNYDLNIIMQDVTDWSNNIDENTDA